LLAEKLGDIHMGVPAVHVAGTKGKGSTAAMISAVLSSAGYKVGLFTSPHLHTVVERVRVDLNPISEDTFAALVEQMWPAVEWVGDEGGFGDVTFFELMTAMAFLHFRQIKADYQVIEVGLGGRLDSTNVLEPVLSVITSISLDHVATLGDTIEKIAREKAGIIKTGVPVVVAPQAEPDATKVFREVAQDRQAPLFEVQDRMRWAKRDSDASGQAFTLSGTDVSRELWTPLIGDHQLENAATAVAAIETLDDRGVSPESIVAGLRDVRWPGRLEVLQHQGRTVVVDGAHNPYSVKRLVQAVRDYFSFEGVVLVFAALGGHSATGMLAELKTLDPRVVMVRSRHPRSGPTGPAAQAAAEIGLEPVLQSDTVSGGLDLAIGVAEPGDLVLCTGSLSVAAEVIEELRGIPRELYPHLQGPPGGSAVEVS
jgi:dihydrofolate synthase/folylpolyglutamate synthase